MSGYPQNKSFETGPKFPSRIIVCNLAVLIKKCTLKTFECVNNNLKCNFMKGLKVEILKKWNCHDYLKNKKLYISLFEGRDYKTHKKKTLLLVFWGKQWTFFEFYQAFYDRYGIDYPANSLIHILITCYFENEIMILVNMIYVNRLTKFTLFFHLHVISCDLSNCRYMK